jgi:hypothetical protein
MSYHFCSLLDTLDLLLTQVLALFIVEDELHGGLVVGDKLGDAR